MHKSDQFISINPIDQNILSEVESWTSERIETEIKQGEIDWEWWKSLQLSERLQQILEIQKALIERRKEAAQIITKEMGKPIGQSLSEIDKCIDLCEYYTKVAQDTLEPQTVSGTAFSYNQIRFQPLGGILGVMPWNFPFWQVFRFAIPALITGNVVWLKHAPNVSMCNQLLEELFNCGLKHKIYRAAFVQVEHLEQLVGHRHIQGTSLTGSERAGSSFAALSGKHIKKSVLELGGNDAFIVCEDADLNLALNKAVFSRMINTGQTCISTKRLYIPNSKQEEVKTILEKELSNYKAGDLSSSDTKIGVMARPDLVESILTQIKELDALGYTLWIKEGEDKDSFVAPRVYFTEDKELFYDKELFGPVLIVYGYDAMNEVVDSVNASEFGLGAAIWSNHIDEAKKLANLLDVGSIALNNIVQSNVYLPFGGIKKSGFGRELGQDALLEFVNKKVIYS